MSTTTAAPPTPRRLWPHGLFRLSNLVVLVAVVALGVLAWLFWGRSAGNQPQPLPLGPGEAEVVWLQTASNTSGWERLVTAAVRAHEQRPELLVDVDEKTTFPPQSTDIPQFAVRLQGRPGKLLFRWYKITADWKTSDWVRALVAGRPPPLAVVGGDNSEPAIELAQALRDATADLPEASRPLYCITTATANTAAVAGPDGALRTERLTEIYPGRTFRFCFTNDQMAEAVIDFIWSRDELRPDAEPAYIVHWADDTYSRDLSGPGGGFATALAPRAATLRAGAVAGDLAWLAGARGTGGYPLDVQALTTTQYGLGGAQLPQTIDSGIGGFDPANPFEVDVADYVLDELSRNYHQRRPLLLLSAKQAPTRRFLRALVRAAPADSQRFVVGTGDSIGFNTVYRDRNVAWPIQDLPFPLVFFAHRNPVDEAVGFRPASGKADDANRSGESWEATSTDMLLLDRDIVQTLVQAAWQDGGLVPDADRLREGFLQAAWLPEEGTIAVGRPGVKLFTAHGNRHRLTGEHLVYLMPVAAEDRVPPRAVVSVWPRRAPGQPWDGQPVKTLVVTYDGYAGKGARP